MALQYVVGDKVVTESQLIKGAEPKKREQRPEKSFFKGWRVEGFMPGQIAQAQADREKEIALFDHMLQKDPAGGGQAPQAFRSSRLPHEHAAQARARKAVRASRSCRALQANGREGRLGACRAVGSKEGVAQ